MTDEQDLINLLIESDSGAKADDGVGHRSAATDNATMMARIADLYFRPGMTIADPMRGSDVFWKNVNRDLYDLRLTDIKDGTDARMLPYADQSLHAVVLDPPYRYVENATTAAGLRMLEGNGYNLESVRGKGHDAVMGLYRDVMREAERVLMRGGYMVVKCQDTITDGKQQWVHVDLMQFATSIGCEPIDLAVVTPAQVPPTRWKVQRSLRKSHSYFIVCRKGGRWPFGYRSVSSR